MAELKATLILSTTNSEDNITFDNEDILSFSTRNRTTSDPNVPIYNSFATNGTLVVSDTDLNLYNKALNGVFDKYKYIIEFELDGRRIATHTIRERPKYDFVEKSLTIQLGSKLDILDELSYEGKIVLRSETTLQVIPQTAKDLMDDLLLSAFAIKEGDEEYENLMTEEFSDIFSNIVIPIPYMPAKTYREAFQNVLTLAKCALTVDEYDNLRFVRKDTNFANFPISTFVKSEDINTAFVPTIIVENKYDDCAISAARIGLNNENAEMDEKYYFENDINNFSKEGDYSQLVPESAVSYDIYLKLSDDTTAQQKTVLNDLGFSESSDIDYKYYWGKYENSEFKGFINTDDITNWFLKEDKAERYFFGAIGAKVGFYKTDFNNEDTQLRSALCGISLYVKRQIYKLPNIEISRFTKNNLSLLYKTDELTPDYISIVFTKKTILEEGTFTLYSPISDVSLNRGNTGFYWKRFQVGVDSENDILNGAFFKVRSYEPEDPKEVSGVISVSDEFENVLNNIGFVGEETISDADIYGLPTYGADSIKMKLEYYAPDSTSPRVVSSWIENKTTDTAMLSNALVALGYKYEVYKINGTLTGDISNETATTPLYKFWDSVTTEGSGISVLKREGIPCTKTIIEYIPKEVHLTINGQVTTITLNEEELTLFSNSENLGTVNTYGNLLQYRSYDNNRIINEIEDIVAYYSNGIHTATLEVLGANKYEMSDGSELDRPFRNGDVLDIKDYTGEDSIMNYPNSPIPMKWQVVQNELSFDGGAVYQALQLQELPWIASVGLEFGDKAVSDFDTVYSVIGYDESENIVKIPERNNGKTVVGISADAFANNDSIKTIIMPNSIINLIPSTFTKLGTTFITGCFEGCTAIESISLSSSIGAITEECFCGCSSLKKFISPKNLGSILANAFTNCTSLKTLEISNSVKLIGTNVLSGCSSLSEIRYNGTYEEWRNLQKDTGWNGGTPNFSVICQDANIILDKEDYAHIVNGNKVAKGGIKINSGIEPTELYIPTISTINTIAEGGYENTYGVTTIHIGSNITTIEASAFQGCEDVTTVYLPKSVKSIGDYAFAIITSNLVTIEYQGSEDKWNNIKKTANWNGNWALVTVTFKDEM